MNIHEYQAKELLRRYGVAVLDGHVARSPEEAEAAAKRLPGPRLCREVADPCRRPRRGALQRRPERQGRRPRGEVGRGREGRRSAMVGHTLVTKQTGPQGKTVSRVYVEDGCDIRRELYLGLLVDRDSSRVTVMASTEGGMEIEEVAEHHPEKILKVAVDPASASPASIPASWPSASA